MTGFATADLVVAPFRLAWEIRSVNHRFLELSFRLPDELRALEPECRDMVGAAVGRGKVDCNLRVSASSGDAQSGAVVDDALLELRALQDQIRTVFPDARPLSAGEVLRWPGVLKEPEQHVLTLAQPAKHCLAAAIQALQTARSHEGERIVELLDQRLNGITALTGEMKPLLDGAQTRYRERL
ncbi:MAG TPA: YicC/YloC family endoribonuclease, partial [Gammaproteobacteria bacterium]|nr:YicC/YloC family endoribonuclease [Gammaproteobacteria bacterium]